jgi:hypothetical protein
VLIAVVVFSALVVWGAEANIDYAINMDYVYQKDGDKWVTYNWLNETQINGTFIEVECVNRGGFTGSFSLLVTFTNATVATAAAEPYELINGTTAKLSYQLGGNEAHSRDVYFTINGDAKSFRVSFTVESNQLLLRSDATLFHMSFLGNTADYEYWDNQFVPNAHN